MKKTIFLILLGCLIWAASAGLGYTQTSPPQPYIGDEPPSKEMILNTYMTLPNIMGPGSDGLSGVIGIHKEKEGSYVVIVSMNPDPKNKISVVLMYDLWRLETKEWISVLPNSAGKKYFKVLNMK